MDLDAAENFRERFKRWSRTLPHKFEKVKNAVFPLFIAGGGVLGFAYALQSGGLGAIPLFSLLGAMLGIAAYVALQILIEKMINFVIGVTIATVFFLILAAIINATL